jgi:beta-N-acetylhexosaminidase
MQTNARLEVPADPDLMAGQMTIGGFAGKTLPDPVQRALGEGRLAGVILMGRNLGTPPETRALTDSIRAASPLPPLIMVDQEGGRVMRLPEPFTPWPSLRELGRKDESGLARETAAAMAAELTAAGINVNLAPVLDVDSNPANPVIGDRSLGLDPERVAILGTAMIEGFRQAGLICCAKHFPGHGDAAVDSHSDLPVVDADRATLDRRELRPFEAAVHARVPMVMTAHVKYPGLDPYYPATLSHPILTQLLRLEMGFGGVILTDDLEMGALARYMPIADAAYSAVKAGADLLLSCSGLEAAEAVGKTVREGLKHGLLNMDQVMLAVRRVLALKEQYLLAAPAVAPEPAVIGCARHRQLAQRIRG